MRSEPVPAIHSDGVRPDVSVVIPVHNTARFLAKCVESVLAQSGVILEVICVDDGSSDSSADALAELGAADPRVRVLKQENAGASVARNAGIGVASGRYLCFVDSDDWWRRDELAALVKKADDEQLELLLFDAIAVREPDVTDHVWERFRDYYKRGSYPGVRTGPELLAAMRAVQEYRASPCLYLISHEHLRQLGLLFYPGIIHEDNLFTFQLMLGTTRASHSEAKLYSRRLRPGSTMTASSRIASARGYLITYLEMQRMAGRTPFPEPIASQVGAIIFSAFKQAIDNFVKVNTDVGDRLRELDPLPEAQAAVMLLKRLRYEAQFKRGSAKPNKSLAPAQQLTFGQRVVRKLRRMKNQMVGSA